MNDSIRMPEMLANERWNKGGDLRQLHEEHIYAMLGAKDDANRISPTWMLVGGQSQMVFGTPWKNGGELAAYVSSLGRTMREQGIEMYSMVIPIEMMMVSRKDDDGTRRGEKCILIVSRSRTEQLVTRFAVSPMNRLMERDDWDDAQVGERQGWINTNLLIEDAPELEEELERHRRHEEAHQHHSGTEKMSISGAEGVWLLRACTMTLQDWVNDHRDETLGKGVGYRFGEDVSITIVLSTGNGKEQPLRCVVAGTLDREVMLEMFKQMAEKGPERSQNICTDDV